MKYTLFVDESGQSGIKRIRSGTSGGASRYMTLGGALVPNTKKDTITNLLDSLSVEFGRPDLHCSRMNHNQIVRYAQSVAREQVLLFGVISLKETLGSYKEDISEDHTRYYNKCAQYLLEKVGLFMTQKDLNEDQLSVVFEEGNFNYSALRSLISHCRKKPIRPGSRTLDRVNPFSITSQPKSEEPLLQICDLVAHALFRCVDDGPSTYGVYEPRYVLEMKSRFFADEEGVVCGYGIFPVHELKDIKASKEIREFLEKLRSG